MGVSWFTLLWERKSGEVVDTQYCYTKLWEQSTFTRKGWILHCIAVGKSVGLKYRGMRKG